MNEFIFTLVKFVVGHAHNTGEAYTTYTLKEDLGVSTDSLGETRDSRLVYVTRNGDNTELVANLRKAQNTDTPEVRYPKSAYKVVRKTITDRVTGEKSAEIWSLVKNWDKPSASTVKPEEQAVVKEETSEEPKA